MTFINGLLALGAAAFTIPLVIHLLYRNRFKTVSWGAMHLLEPVVRINRRRIRWTNFLLLLIRCLLPVLLALCLARPVLTGFRALQGDSPESIVLVIDDSQSMAARDESGVSRIDRVRNELGQSLGEFSPRDEILWMPTSQIEFPPSTMGTVDAVDKLKTIRTSSGPFDIARVLRAAVKASNAGVNARKRIVFASDFQGVNTSDASVESLRTFADELKNDSSRPDILFWNLADLSRSIDNVSIDSIETLSPAIVPDRETRFAARLRNATDQTLNDLRVNWLVDGTQAASQTISIPARSTSTANMRYALLESGLHEISVSVEFVDGMSEDNNRSIAVEVIREIEVVLVDGQPSNEPLRGETDFLAIALSPFAFSQQDQVDAVRASVIREGKVVEVLSEKTPNILVLANVASLDEKQQSKIVEFVESGGSLISFDGIHLGDANYVSRLLPASIGTIVGDPNARQNAEQSAPMRIGMLSSQYAPWQKLAPANTRPLEIIDVFAYRKLIIDPDASDEDKPTVILAMKNGDPLVVSARRGRGRIVQFAIPADADWTTLPLRRLFVPMVQQLALDLIGSGKMPTVTTGQPMIVSLDELMKTPSAENDSEESVRVRYTVEPPGSAEIDLDVDSQQEGQLVWTATQLAGVYRFRRIEIPVSSDENNPPGNLIKSTVRVAQVPSEESKLRPVLPGQLAAIAGFLDATVYDRANTLRDAEQTRRYGREIWRWLLVALLVAMILELVVQQRSAPAKAVTPTMNSASDSLGRSSV
ncbi:hypothetical protein CA13_13570 [Planctomycetes bacterium CA13]|uniref:Aerotolerance regulator N-terminal domain-containing protein n=1 Tax=Novipirellula herctigrandis TaxID=2527986 RepID=A0A5C5YYZ9_9BACT|nr:hypothetical protein CA13_13570 [Planctomycetes bacterium CA13]